MALDSKGVCQWSDLGLAAPHERGTHVHLFLLSSVYDKNMATFQVSGLRPTTIPRSWYVMERATFDIR